ncbi:MAG: DUF1616 domain-containing protein [Candidatus Methanomethylicaceae archaeon]|nr:DUF1616 domain-containing protein [Candidatus Verstraetearchaeota archaeon]
MSWILNDEVLAVIAAIIVVSGVFATIQILNTGRVVEPFSELGLLGPEGKIANYPRVIEAGKPFRINVYIGNHEGHVMYYRILIKIGDKNSTIPLTNEPIMEIRSILMHNTSEIIPIDIIVNNLGDNIRLVFEMWIYNETIGSFTYHGRWNQLWLNVTGEEGKSMSKFILNPDVEEAIITGYLAIRKAEVNGGDISKMVELLRKALFNAMNGDFVNAKSFAIQVVSMEPEVSRVGIEAERFKLLINISELTIVIVLSIGIYIYLRERFWIYLTRFYKNWKVVWKGNNEGLNDIEKSIKKFIKSKGQITLESLVFSGIMKPSQMAKTIFNLIRKGVLELVDLNLPKSFLSYLYSKHNLGFIISVVLICLCIFTVYFSNIFPILSILRIILGSLFVLFLPGYSLIEALYPREEELSPLERLALSIGLSLAIVPLVGLILNYTPWGIRLDPIITALSFLTLGLLLISSYRKYYLKKIIVFAKPSIKTN